MGNQPSSSSSPPPSGLQTRRRRNNGSPAERARAHLGSSSSNGGGADDNNNNNDSGNGGNSNGPFNMNMPTQIRHLLNKVGVENPGSLGLSKAELDKRCQPSGLYPTCQWEDRAIRRLVGDGKIAARLPGHESRVSPGDQECPICFLHYSDVNVTSCCQAIICTECFLQVRPQKEKKKCGSCPFCNGNKLVVTAAKPLDKEQILERQKEEQCVIASKISAQVKHAQQQQLADTVEASLVAQKETADPLASLGPDEWQGSSDATEPPSSFEFGTSSHRSSFDDAGVGGSDEADSNSHCRSSVTILTTTPEERRLLEEEMQRQRLHPTAQRVLQEEAERRLQNDLAFHGRVQEERAARRRELLRNYARSQGLGRVDIGLTPREAAGAIRRGSARGGGGRRPPQAASMPASTMQQHRDRNRIADAFESGRNGSVQSLDDLVILEAALMLSMQEGGSGDPRARAAAEAIGSRLNNNSSLVDAAGILMRGISEEEQIAMAIAASLEESGQQEQEQTSQQQEADSSNINSEELHRESGGEGEVNVAAGHIDDQQQQQLTTNESVGVSPVAVATETPAAAEEAGANPPE